MYIWPQWTIQKELLGSKSWKISRTLATFCIHSFNAICLREISLLGPKFYLVIWQLVYSMLYDLIVLTNNFLLSEGVLSLHMHNVHFFITLVINFVVVHPLIMLCVFDLDLWRFSFESYGHSGWSKIHQAQMFDIKPYRECFTAALCDLMTVNFDLWWQNLKVSSHWPWTDLLKMLWVIANTRFLWPVWSVYWLWQPLA